LAIVDSNEKTSNIQKRSFDDIYINYYTLIYKYIYKRINNHEISESLVSDVFYRTFKNYDTYNPECASVKTWLFCITNNVLKNYYRDKRIINAIDEFENSLEFVNEDIMEESIYLQECRDALAKAIEGLSERNKSIIIMKYFENKSAGQIADELGITPGNVRICAMRALKKLSEILTKQGFVWEGL